MVIQLKQHVPSNTFKQTSSCFLLSHHIWFFLLTFEVLLYSLNLSGTSGTPCYSQPGAYCHPNIPKYLILRIIIRSWLDTMMMRGKTLIGQLSGALSSHWSQGSVTYLSYHHLARVTFCWHEIRRGAECHILTSHTSQGKNILQIISKKFSLMVDKIG